MPMPPTDPPSSPRRRNAAAQGIMLALLLSAPVWLGLGLAIWAATRP
jgi:hypothetical protein